MKRLFTILFAFIPLIASSQSSEVKVSLRNGTAIEGIVKEFDALDHITIIVGGIETTIPMSQVAYISKLGGQSQTTTESNPSSTSQRGQETVRVIEENPLKDFKGFLLAKGNNVYVESSNSDRDRKATYDKEGAMVIRTFLKRDGFWNVVDKKNQAHFIIHYNVITINSDKSQLLLSSRKTGKYYFLGRSGTNESELKNNVVAQHFYNKEIKSLQKKIEKNKIPKKLIEDFTVK